MYLGRVCHLPSAADVILPATHPLIQIRRLLDDYWNRLRLYDKIAAKDSALIGVPSFMLEDPLSDTSACSACMYICFDKPTGLEL